MRGATRGSRYADATRTKFKKPTRLECMMQDLPKLLAKELGNSAKVGFTTMERWLTFSPAKNAPDAGAAAAAAGAPPGSPASSEADVYAAFRATLVAASGTVIEQGAEQTFAGMPVTLLPCIVLAPSFAAGGSAELARRFHGGRISGRSSLVVEGDVEVSGLDLDGALVLRATQGAKLSVRGLNVRNRGWEFVPADAPEVLKMRGFRLVKHETKEVEVTEGRWILGPDGLARDE
jgi:UDP-sugar pyrophosphorylase